MSEDGISPEVRGIAAWTHLSKPEGHCTSFYSFFRDRRLINVANYTKDGAPLELISYR